ncbi:MAG: formylglycine-generating enzyme family protein [Cyanobacteria bacterium P01_F01_bin.150]
MATSSSTAPRKIREERETTTFRFGQERLNDEVLLNLVRILAGGFIMGSPEGEEGRSDAEGPQRLVSVSEFWMGQYPVTQQEWRIVAGYTKVERDMELDPSHFKGGRRPVERVSWDDAVEFCQRLSQHTGRNYRLPSEAEWEYACRAETKTPFHLGLTLSAKYSNYDAREVYGLGTQGEYRRGTVDVDHFQVTNNFGLVGMHGNVWEWCQDHWHESYKGAPLNGSAWMENTSHSKNRDCVFRGGAWLTRPRDCRSAFRGHNLPAYRRRNLGFRVVLAPQ